MMGEQFIFTCDTNSSLFCVQPTHSCVQWMCMPRGSWWWTSWPGHSWETNWQLSTLYYTCSPLCESHSPTTLHLTCLAALALPSFSPTQSHTHVHAVMVVQRC